MKKTLLKWLPLAFTITVLCGLVYVAIQQDYRQNANDPQVQVTEDTADAISNGLVTPEAYAFNQKTDVAKSLSPFMVIYDNQGKPITASGLLNAQAPIPPAGVFNIAQNHDDYRFTWQPQKGVRLATVVRKYSTPNSSGYVLMGRSLKEVEKREDSLLWLVLAAWIVALAGSFVLKTSWFISLFNPRSAAVSGNENPVVVEEVIVVSESEI